MPCPHFWRASATRSISARKLLWALLDRIMSRPIPGRAISSRLRRLRLGAHRRRGRRDDRPFVPSPQQRAPLGELPPKRRSPPDAALRPARPASRGKRERESDPSWCHASPGHRQQPHHGHDPILHPRQLADRQSARPGLQGPRASAHADWTRATATAAHPPASRRRPAPAG